MTADKCINCIGTIRAREIITKAGLPVETRICGAVCDIRHQRITDEDIKSEDCYDRLSDNVPVYIIDIVMCIEYRNKFNHVVSSDRQTQRVIRRIEPENECDWHEIYEEAMYSKVKELHLPIRPDGKWIQRNIYACNRYRDNSTVRETEDKEIVHIRISFVSDIQLNT